MRICLLRHGIAEDAGPGTPDDQRKLTDKGKTKLEGVVRLARRAFKEEKIELELILSSPLVRAVQTAEMTREILEVKAPVQQTDALVPEANPRKTWDELRGLRKLEAVLLAGHEPHMSHLAAFLLGAPSLHVHMAKAGLVSIEMESFGDHPQGTLEWMLTPKLL